MRQLICSYYEVCVFTVKTYKLKIQETEQPEKKKKRENKQNWNKNLVQAKLPLVPGGPWAGWWDVHLDFPLAINERVS